MPDYRKLLDTPMSSGAFAPPRAGFAPPVMPNVQGSIETMPGGPGASPQFGGSIGAPMLGGDVSVRGQAMRPHPQAPIDWNAVVQFLRRF